MLNYETILSSYDDKMTLMQWLKKVEEALNHASATAFRVNKKGNATISFILDFEDGTTLESGDIVLQQGESVNGAYMQNGHLFVTLTNGQIFDVGNLKPVTRFEINTSQHLIVYYGDGTNQDLGAIFSGNVNIDGNFTANSIIENMSGYSFAEYAGFSNKGVTEPIYAGACKNGNKLTLVYAFNFTPNENASGSAYCARFYIPSSVMNKIYPAFNSIVSSQTIDAVIDNSTRVQIVGYTIKQDNISLYFGLSKLENLTPNIKYYIRLEVTFLLSDNLISE